MRDALKEIAEGVEEADESGAYIAQGRLGDQVDHIQPLRTTKKQPTKPNFKTLALLATHDKNKLKQKTKFPKKSSNQSNRNDVVAEVEGDQLLEAKSPDYVEKPPLDLDSQAGLSISQSVV